MNATAKVPHKMTSLLRKKHEVNIEDEAPEFFQYYNCVIDDKSVQDTDNTPSSGEDTYIDMQLDLPHRPNATPMSAIIKKRSLDSMNAPIGNSHNNPLLDTRQYTVEFANGYTEILTVNIIAENLLSQVDEDGHQQRMFREIIDHRQLENAVNISGGTFTTARGLTR